MKKSEFNRRDFNRLTAAAMGGLMTGAVVGCSGAPADGEGDADGDGGDNAAAQLDDSLLLAEPHVCRGLNACMNHGASGENACAGQGACATADAHECATLNKCKGQGGCGESAGRNACDTKGKCARPP